MGAYLSKLLDDALEKPQEELFNPGKSFRVIFLLLIFLSDWQDNYDDDESTGYKI